MKNVKSTLRLELEVHTPLELKEKKVACSPNSDPYRRSYRSVVAELSQLSSVLLVESLST